MTKKLKDKGQTLKISNHCFGENIEQIIVNQSEIKTSSKKIYIFFFEMIPSPGRDQRLTARVAPGINLGVVQGDSCYGENFVK